MCRLLHVRSANGAQFTHEKSTLYSLDTWTSGLAADSRVGRKWATEGKTFLRLVECWPSKGRARWNSQPYAFRVKQKRLGSQALFAENRPRAYSISAQNIVMLTYGLNFWFWPCVKLKNVSCRNPAAKRMGYCSGASPSPLLNLWRSARV